MSVTTALRFPSSLPRVDVYADIALPLLSVFVPALRRAAHSASPVERLVLRRGRTEDEVAIDVAIRDRDEATVYLGNASALDENTVFRAVMLVVAGMVARALRA